LRICQQRCRRLSQIDHAAPAAGHDELGAQLVTERDGAQGICD
jgi:hypothetical protein